MSKITFSPEKVCQLVKDEAIRLGLFPDVDLKDIVSGFVLTGGKPAGVFVGTLTEDKSVVSPIEINPDALKAKKSENGNVLNMLEAGEKLIETLQGHLKEVRAVQAVEKEVAEPVKIALAPGETSVTKVPHV